jgi:ATP-binding cassette subfamily B protein
MKFIADLSRIFKLGREEEKDAEKLDPKLLVRTYKVFGCHYKKYWKILAAAYSCLFLVIGVEVLAPWPLKLILDHLILKQPMPEALAFLNPWVAESPKLLLLLLALAIVLLALLEAVLSFINKFWVSGTGDRIVADVRERVFAHLQKLSLSFHEGARSGNLLYVLTSDAGVVKNLLIDLPQDFTRRFVTFGVCVGLMLALDWRLCLVALSTAPLIYLFTKYFSAGLKKAVKKLRKTAGEASSIIIENLSAMALVQAYGREETELARYRAQVREGLKASLQSLRLQRTFSRISDFLFTLSTAGVLYFGGRYALGGDILPGTLVVFVAYMRDIYGTLDHFRNLFIGLATSQVSCEKVLELVENDQVVQDDPQAMPAPAFSGEIEFKNVSFAYKKGAEVLKNINFAVAPGETVALVGHSGAGKSTLISLLLRFYDPQQGQILIDGRDIRAFTLRSLRDQMTIVLQEAKLFRQTVRENIAFGKIGAAEEEIIAAAQSAEAHEFITQMSEGYETMMYEGGDNLSGGQKQRLNIARAMLRDTPIMILDEPVTGLDARAEAKVNAAIHRLTRGKTTFIIAHKFSTIAGADKILLLEKGRLAHQGAHDELMRASPPYRELYELQFGPQRKLAAAEEVSEGSNGKIDTENELVVAPSGA